jgi:hypothetical protein
MCGTVHAVHAKSISDLMESRVYCESMWLEFVTTQQLLVQVRVFPIEFRQHLWNYLWDTWKDSFMALYKPGFIVDK